MKSNESGVGGVTCIDSLMSASSAAGHYFLKTFESKDGAFPRNHRVAMDAERERASHRVSPGYEGANIQFERVMPTIDADPGSSPLEARMQNNTIRFDVPR